MCGLIYTQVGEGGAMRPYAAVLSTFWWAMPTEWIFTTVPCGGSRVRIGKSVADFCPGFGPCKWRIWRLRCCIIICWIYLPNMWI